MQTLFVEHLVGGSVRSRKSLSSFQSESYVAATYITMLIVLLKCGREFSGFLQDDTQVSVELQRVIYERLMNCGGWAPSGQIMLACTSKMQRDRPLLGGCQIIVLPSAFLIEQATLLAALHPAHFRLAENLTCIH